MTSLRDISAGLIGKPKDTAPNTTDRYGRVGGRAPSRSCQARRDGRGHAPHGDATMKFVFLFACASFVCQSQPAKPGDGQYYETRDACMWVGKSYALRNRISLGTWDLICVERERPEIGDERVSGEK